MICDFFEGSRIREIDISRVRGEKTWKASGEGTETMGERHRLPLLGTGTEGGTRALERWRLIIWSLNH